MLWLANLLSAVFSFLAAVGVFKWVSFSLEERRYARMAAWCMVFVGMVQGLAAVMRFLGYW